MKTTRIKGDAEDRRTKLEDQKRAIRERLSHIRRKILVMSGKGGVGKSSIAAYLSVSLAHKGHRVGLLDVDLHGPSIARMLGLTGEVCACGGQGKISPIHFLPNLEVVSIETLTGGGDAATIWRGPMKGAAIRQFIADVEWGPLDYLVIDSPPGTGDEPLTVAQTIPGARALIVTTPQEIALADVRKSIRFCRKVEMGVLGLVENMSGLTCPHCGGRIDLFQTGGGKKTARAEHLDFLGSLPMDPEVVENGDQGRVHLLKDESRAFTQAFRKVVEAVEVVFGNDPALAAEEPLEPIVT